MKRLLFVLGTASALAFPATSLGKGATEATIDGPGLDGPITLAGEGRPAGEQLEQFAELTGFFPAVFVRQPDPMLDERPAGALGPRYEVSYEMPGPNGELDTLHQDLYPFAEAGVVTYMKPGQPFFGTDRTRGGWHVAAREAQHALVAAGLPSRPLGSRDDDSGASWVTGGVAALVVILALGSVAALVVILALGSLAAFVVLGRRPRPGPA